MFTTEAVPGVGGEDVMDDVKEESYFGAWPVVAHEILLC